jgi:hypothetical protein
LSHYSSIDAIGNRNINISRHDQKYVCRNVILGENGPDAGLVGFIFMMMTFILIRIETNIRNLLSYIGILS